MKITVLNGSPKGDYSITLQTVKFIEKHNPAHSFTVLNVGQMIKTYEKNFPKAAEALKEADMILFSYPVYTFIVPSQLHHFIELMKEAEIDLHGKYATQISTSKHFYDVTAHKFIEENAQDMGLKFIKGLSADMDDLTKEQGRKDALAFFDYAMWCCEHDVFEPVPERKSDYFPVPPTVPAGQTKEKAGDIVIVADLAEDDAQLAGMIERFRVSCDMATRLVNIRQFPFRGGCLSCFGCATDGKCVYADGFDSFLRGNIQTAQAIVIAFSVKDHSMGSRFKMYDDRQFCNGHRTVTMGRPFGYIVSGDYSGEKNLQTIIEGRAEVGGNFLAGVATDEKDTDREIDDLALKLVYAVKNAYVQPSNFLGVGGMKIFRDLIWLMQGMMRADHRFYKSHGQYDFPQKERGTMLKMYLVGSLMSNEKLMKKAGGKVREGMIAPYKKVLEKY